MDLPRSGDPGPIFGCEPRRPATPEIDKRLVVRINLVERLNLVRRLNFGGFIALGENPSPRGVLWIRARASISGFETRARDLKSGPSGPGRRSRAFERISVASATPNSRVGVLDGRD